jgi:hypothetical protein
MVLGITLPIAIGAGILGGMLIFGQRAAAPSPVASAAPVCKPEPAPSALPPASLTERASTGDYKALDELKAKTPDTRSAAETLALATGRSHNKGAALEGFAKEIKKNPDLLKNKEQLQRLRDFLNDRETANQAAGVIVDLPGNLGPDLLYDAAGSPKSAHDTAELADDLLEAKEVREKASPALGVTLELIDGKQCEDFKALLPKVAELGDRRALSPLIKLANKRGCGEKKSDDCYACLRDLDNDKKAIDLADAITAVKKRSAPKL